MKIAIAFEEAAQKKRTSRQVRRVIQDLHQEITGEGLESLGVEDFFLQWLKDKEGEVGESTLKFYRQVVTSFLDFLGEGRSVDLDAITTNQIKDFRDDLRNRGLAAKTVNHRIKGIRMIFQEAKHRGRIADDPTEPVKVLKEQRGTQRRPFKVEELRKLLKHARATDERCGTEWESLILFGLHTGQRLGDLACLNWGHVDLEANEIAIRTRKTGRQVRVPISEPLMTWIESLPAVDDPEAFVHPASQACFVQANGSRTLSRQFGELLASAGFRDKRPHRKSMSGAAGRARPQESLSFHSLRYTTVSMMKNAGISPAVVQDLVGHESAEISAHYTRIDREAKAKAVSVLADLSEEM